MKLTKKEIKQRHFDKVYANAKTIKCKCGCGKETKDKDKYGRAVEFISGHNNKIYDDPKQHKREWNKRNKKARYLYKEKYQRKRKVLLIKELGSKCSQCGTEYNGENGALFQFHHRDPEQKIMTLGLNKMGLSWERIINESKKCDLLCANCHSLIHSSKY